MNKNHVEEDDLSNIFVFIKRSVHLQNIVHSLNLTNMFLLVFKKKKKEKNKGIVSKSVCCGNNIKTKRYQTNQNEDAGVENLRQVESGCLYPWITTEQKLYQVTFNTEHFMTEA